MYAKIINWFNDIAVPKTKGFFQKYWGYLAAFLVGLLSALGINAARNSRARENISRLRRELEQYADLNRRLEEYANRLEQQLSELSGINESAQLEVLPLSHTLIQSRADIEQIESRLDAADDLARRSVDGTDRIQRESDKGGEGINSLREFLDKYGTQGTDIQDDHLD